MNLLIRTDGGPDIGGGHVMRCLALAQAWRDMQGEAAFLCGRLSDGLRRRIVDAGFPADDLAAPLGSDDDATSTVARAHARRASLVVADGYRLGTRYREILRAAALGVVGIDDNGEIGRYVDDILINPNLHASPDLYPDRAPHTRLLLGTDHALLRREFRQTRPPDRPARPVAAILLTMGAADPANATVATIDVAARSLGAGIHMTVVVGMANPHRQMVEKAVAAQPDCTVLVDPAERMPELMAGADLAITAVGSTVWEMAYMGLPFIGIVIADNQAGPAAALARQGYPILGVADMARDLPSSLVALIADAARRARLAALGRRLVDGHGCERVVAAIATLPAAG